MTARAIRDALAEALRVERLGLISPSWSDWSEIDDAACEEVRRRADHIIRLLAEAGVELIRTGEPRQNERLDSPIIMRCQLVGDPATERAIRREEGDLWSIVTIKGGVETPEQSFSLKTAMLNAGAVLSGDPDALTITALGRRLAAYGEIHRLCAAGFAEAK